MNEVFGVFGRRDNPSIYIFGMYVSLFYGILDHGISVIELEFLFQVFIVYNSYTVYFFDNQICLYHFQGNIFTLPLQPYSIAIT